MEKPQLQIDLKTTTAIEGFNDGVLYQQGFILRKVSKFLVGGDDDSILPIPIFYDIETKRILESSIPAELRGEYRDHLVQ